MSISPMLLEKGADIPGFQSKDWVYGRLSDESIPVWSPKVTSVSLKLNMEVWFCRGKAFEISCSDDMISWMRRPSRLDRLWRDGPWAAEPDELSFQKLSF